MTAYVAIPNGDIDQDSPVSQPLMQALRDNPLAMFEGAVGAPRLQLAALDPGFTTAGGVGAYVFAYGSVDTAFGATVAGSTLFPTSAARSIPVGTSTSGATFNAGAALAGTWRCMGTFDLTAAFGSGGSMAGATLWMRIA